MVGLHYFNIIHYCFLLAKSNLLHLFTTKGLWLSLSHELTTWRKRLGIWGLEEISTRNQWWNLPPLVMCKALADGHEMMKLNQLCWPCGRLKGSALCQFPPSWEVFASGVHGSILSSEDSIYECNSKCQCGLLTFFHTLLHLPLLCMCKNMCSVFCWGWINVICHLTY